MWFPYGERSSMVYRVDGRSADEDCQCLGISTNAEPANDIRPDTCKLSIAPVTIPFNAFIMPSTGPIPVLPSIIAKRALLAELEVLLILL